MSRAALSVRPLAARKAKLRDAVFARDKGVCAGCGFNTERLRKRLLELRHLAQGSSVRTKMYVDLIKGLGIRDLDHLWEADHTVPLVEGGADDLSNLRTLCCFGPPENPGCHRKETNELAARRARRPQRRRRA